MSLARWLQIGPWLLRCVTLCGTDDTVCSVSSVYVKYRYPTSLAVDRRTMTKHRVRNAHWHERVPTSLAGRANG